MPEIIYLAYGSNMLTARLRERCPSVRPLGRAWVPGWQLTFDKLGRDGSGKATIIPATAEDMVSGTLFNMSASDLPALDRAEWGYIRHDDFSVTTASGPQPVLAVTYIAPPQICRSGLSPFDWYLELIKAGQREHGCSEEDLRSLSDIPTIQDGDSDRSARMFRLSRGAR